MVLSIRNEYHGNDEPLPPYVQRTGNFFYGNYLFLLDSLEDEKTYYAIADLTKFVMDTENQAKSLNIFINSPGGSVLLMNTIIGLINSAKLRGLEVNTYIFGIAASAASVIAVTGTKRIMSKNALHFVHFGIIPQYLTKITEIDKSSKFVKKIQKQAEDLYLENCKNLDHDKYLKLIEDEMGYLTADECLKLGFCDEIIEDRLIDLNKQIAKEKDLLEKALIIIKGSKNLKKSEKNDKKEITNIKKDKNINTKKVKESDVKTRSNR